MAKFKLSDEAKAAGLRMGDNENIREEDREAALSRVKTRAEKYESPSVVDQYRSFKTNPEAKAFPVAESRKLKEESLTEPESLAESKSSGSSSKISKMVDRLGGSRVGFTVPDISNRKGGIIKKMAKGGKVRGDGCAQRGKTKGTMR